MKTNLTGSLRSKFDMRELIADNNRQEVRIIELMEQNHRYRNMMIEWSAKIIETIKDGDMGRLHGIKFPDDFTQPEQSEDV